MHFRMSLQILFPHSFFLTKHSCVFMYHHAFCNTLRNLLMIYNCVSHSDTLKDIGMRKCICRFKRVLPVLSLLPFPLEGDNRSNGNVFIGSLILSFLQRKESIFSCAHEEHDTKNAGGNKVKGPTSSVIDNSVSILLIKPYAFFWFFCKPTNCTLDCSLQTAALAL